MKKLSIKIVVFLLLLFGSFIILQKLIDRGLRKDNSGIYKEWNDIYYSRINADILFQGSSRALNHFSPFLFDSAFKMNSYNLGLSGYGFSMQYCRLLFYLEHNKPPKYLIQNIDPITFLTRGNLFEYEQFLPYLNDSIIKESLTEYKGLNWCDFHIPLFKYRSSYALAFTGLLNNFINPPYGNGKYKGFAPHKEHWDTSFANFKSRHLKGYRNGITKKSVSLFPKFMDLCESKGIKVIFVYVPEYYEAPKLLLDRDSIMLIFKNYSSKYHIPILDYSNDSISYDSNNFYNSQHLNASGTLKFNIKLVKDLKSLIK